MTLDAAQPGAAALANLAGRWGLPRPLANWPAWAFEPGTGVLLLCLAGGFALGTARVWSRAGLGRGISRGQTTAFIAGWLTLVVALASPLDGLAEMLLAAHMLQHVLLVAVAAPLLALSRFEVGLIWAAPRRWRRAIARRHWWRLAPVRWAGWCVRPVPSWLLQAAALWLWHLPGPYQAALANAWLHAAEHACFTGTALLYWATVMRPGRLAPGWRILSLLLTGVQSGLLGGLMTFASTPWYPAYRAYAARWGLTPLDDQQLAGLVMWVPASLAYLAGALWWLGRWLGPAPDAPPATLPAPDAASPAVPTRRLPSP